MLFIIKFIYYEYRSKNTHKAIRTISRKRCKIGGKLVLITNKKSYTSFRLVPKWVTLNDVMALILRYFTEFSSFRGALRKWLKMSSYKKFTFAISSPDEFLVLS